MDTSYEVTHDIADIDWRRLADIMARAPLFERQPPELAMAFRNSSAAVFAQCRGESVGAARATCDGVCHASVFDVVVAPEHQGRSVGRSMPAALMAKLPVERIFLASVFGKEPFYAKFGLLRQTNAMGLYREPARSEAVGRGVLLPRTVGSFAAPQGGPPAGRPN